MRFMVLVKASKDSEAGILPDEQILSAMAKYNEELVKAGVMLSGDGLQASSKGARVRFDGKKRTVIDGPFAETKELLAGYWIWQCKSKADAIDWLKRAPFDGGAEVEIRQIFELEASAKGRQWTSTASSRRSQRARRRAERLIGGRARRALSWCSSSQAHKAFPDGHFMQADFQ